MTPMQLRFLYRFIYRLILSKGKNTLLTFFYHTCYSFTLSGKIMHTFLHLAFCLMITYLISPNFTECVIIKSDPIIEDEFFKNTFNITKVLTSSEKEVVKMLTGIYSFLPEKNMALLEGWFMFHENFTECISFRFPLSKLSFSNCILPPKWDSDFICNLFLISVKNPTIDSVYLAGSYINCMYNFSIYILVEEDTPYSLKQEAWHTLELITLEFQVKPFNEFLDVIGYPYRVEDFYEGSAYDRSHMEVHKYSQNAYDPYAENSSLTHRYMNRFKRRFQFSSTTYYSDSFTNKDTFVNSDLFAKRDNFNTSQMHLLKAKHHSIQTQIEIEKMRYNQHLMLSGIILLSSATAVCFGYCIHRFGF